MSRVIEVSEFSLNDETPSIKEQSTNSTQESEFLQLVEDGDFEGVCSLIQSENVNVNCSGRRKRTVVSALQLAAENNNFQLVKLLLDNGATPLDKPHIPNGESECVEIDNMRFHRYSALSSPAYMSLAHDDPFVSAMDLSDELCAMTHAREIEDTSQSLYMELQRQVRQYIAALVNCCDTSKEVLIILSGKGGSLERGPGGLHGFHQLKRAVKSRQKEFVANWKCQKEVKKDWLHGQPKWHTRNGLFWTLLYAVYSFIVYMILMPLLVLVYIIAPCAPLSRILDNPKGKFLSHLYSYMMFLLIVLIVDITMAHDPTVELTAADKTLIVWLLIFACAFLMAGLSQLYRLGPRDYFSDVRNWMDLSIFVPFLVDNTLHITDNFVHVNVMVRIFFDSIAAISLVLACLRFIRFFYLSTFLGPLLLLVVAMNGDVIRFLCICFFTVVSFAFGFYYLYAELDGTGDFNAFFTAISALLNTLFTSDPTSSLYVNVIYNVTDSDGDSYDVHDASIMIAGIGVVMYLFFGVSLIIILVNVCIAMMSDTYARLRENIDIEWKYVRTKMWLEHFDGPVLPPFFNVIPSVTWLMYIARKLCYRQNSTGCLAPRTEDNTLGKDILSLSYTKLTKELINRYMIEKGVVSEEDQMFETNGNVNAIEKNNLGLGGPGVVIHVGPNDEAHQKRDSVN